MQCITGEKGLGDQKGCFHSILEMHCNFHTAFLANNNRPEGTGVEGAALKKRMEE